MSKTAGADQTIAEDNILSKVIEASARSAINKLTSDDSQDEEACDDNLEKQVESA